MTTATTPASLPLSVHVPAGRYRISGPLTIGTSNTTLFGDGPDTTVIVMSDTPTGGGNAGNPVLTVADGLTGVTISNLTITRDTTRSSLHTYPATSGGNGIVVSGSTINHCIIRNVIAQYQWVGFSLGSIAVGYVENCYSLLSQSDGFLFVNSPSNSTLQWTLMNTYSLFNGGWGYRVAATPLSPVGTITMSNWIYPTGFANVNGGVYVLGIKTTGPISRLGIIGGWFTQDNFTEILIDSYGSGHRILATEVSLAGTYFYCGPNQDIGPSKEGYGIQSLNNFDITIVGTVAAQNSYSGINLDGDSDTNANTGAVITGCRVIDNNYYTSTYNGIDVASEVGPPAIIATCVISGCRIGCQVFPTSSAATQEHSVSAAYGTNVLLINNDLRGWINGAISVTSETINEGSVVISMTTTALVTNNKSMT